MPVERQLHRLIHLRSKGESRFKIFTRVSQQELENLLELEREGVDSLRRKLLEAARA